jgi:hypothetical protein
MLESEGRQGRPDGRLRSCRSRWAYFPSTAYAGGERGLVARLARRRGLDARFLLGPSLTGPVKPLELRPYWADATALGERDDIEYVLRETEEGIASRSVPSGP